MKRILLSALMAFLFVGAVSAQTTYYSEDFESGQPADWTVTGEWAYGTAESLASQFFPLTGNASNIMAFNDDGLGNTHTGNGRMETGNIDLTAVTGSVFMELNLYFLDADYGGADESFIVYASFDDGASWSQVKNYGAVTWDFELVSVDDFAGNNVKLAFEYVDGAAWNYGVGIDDITLSDIPINSTRRSYFMTVNGGSTFNTCGQNIDYQVEGIFFNNGYEPVTSFDVTTVNNGESYTETINGLDLAKGEGTRYVLEQKVNTGEDNSSVMVTVSNVNGEVEEDDDASDNSAMINFEPVAVHPDKAVVVEEATGTWCPWCPRGTVYLDEMSKRFGDNFVGIAVHNGQNDPMVLPAYDAAITSFPDFSGFPSVIFNRDRVLDPGDIVAPSVSSMMAAPEVIVELGAEENGSTMTSNVRVRLMEDNPSADYKVAVILTEDDLSGENGNGEQWTQANNYSGGGNGAMGGFELFGTAFDSNLWPYAHVGRALIGGYNGVEALSGNYAAGESNIKEMGDFNINSTWNKDNMHMIAVVTNASGEIVNAKSMKYNDAIANGLLSIGTSTTEVFDASLASVYPSPASVYTNVEINVGSAADVAIEVTNLNGQLVAKRNLGTVAGKQNVNFDVSEFAIGTYVFKVIAGDRISTQKVSVIK
jgi:thiol-disulfide isomerase/thioredoxin